MRKNFSDIDLNRSVGNLLRMGVLLSMLVSLIGFVKLFLEGFKMPKTYEELGKPGQNIFHDFWISLQNFEGMGIIQLGILILIITPVMRVIFALVGYIKEKDYIYIIVSVLVLMIITFSFLMGYG